MTLKMNMEFRKIPKIFLLLCAVLIISPSFLASYDTFHIDDMAWFLLLIPCFIFSYYLGFKGGLFAAFLVNAYHLFWFISEKYLRYSEIVSQEFTLHTGVAIVTFLCSIGVGLLSEKLKEKQIQLQILNDRLKQLALYDSLTGLPNRHNFMESLAKALNGEERVSLMFIDLDGFKRVNDTYGHEVGDNLLKEVTSKLNLLCDDTTFISRLGGDEFTVMIIGEDESKSIQLAHDLIQELQIEINDVMISASIGIAISKHGDSPSSLLKSADMAMYRAKTAGKNTFWCLTRP
jgi:diguanylate cyclase (GGDEF)-like protein